MVPKHSLCRLVVQMPHVCMPSCVGPNPPLYQISADGLEQEFFPAAYPLPNVLAGKAPASRQTRLLSSYCLHQQMRRVHFCSPAQRRLRLTWMSCCHGAAETCQYSHSLPEGSLMVQVLPARRQPG